MSAGYCSEGFYSDSQDETNDENQINASKSVSVDAQKLFDQLLVLNNENQENKQCINSLKKLFEL